MWPLAQYTTNNNNTIEGTEEPAITEERKNYGRIIVICFQKIYLRAKKASKAERTRRQPSTNGLHHGTKFVKQMRPPRCSIYEQRAKMSVPEDVFEGRKSSRAKEEILL